jgi:hypothetical protein
VFVFGGKDHQSKSMTGKSYEIIWTEDDTMEMMPINRMLKERSRSTVANIDQPYQGYDPFIVIIGGSDDNSTINLCELYYPKTNTFYSFPSLKIARENPSSCVFQADNGDLYIYCFGGFDKRAIDDIERIKLNFSQD